MKYEPCRKCGGTGKQIDQKALGRELREIRVKAGISLRRMAFEIGITPPYLCDLELGNRSWNDKRIEEFKRICQEETK